MPTKNSIYGLWRFIWARSHELDSLLSGRVAGRWLSLRTRCCRVESGLDYSKPSFLVLLRWSVVIIALSMNLIV
ncbi:hypothetical protein Ahy_A07g037445 isoform B [Arachis hypogaea]|uniref:Uncharacterized protein n=1 Tax=Arachis hypogaea TaxID=3818 RepID=A0A445CIW2_ARAHY|nr:hypothetical protein Ahy_A07g037445 isoform B [Arachis hypogaea]